jgi:hypothetical protein
MPRIQSAAKVMSSDRAWEAMKATRRSLSHLRLVEQVKAGRSFNLDDLIRDKS